jgi:hypothetical protein
MTETGPPPRDPAHAELKKKRNPTSGRECMCRENALTIPLFELVALIYLRARARRSIHGPRRPDVPVVTSGRAAS